MEIIAHGLWAAAGSIAANRSTNLRFHVGWTAGWAMFPDLLAFGPPVAIGLWMRLTGTWNPGSHGHMPHVNLGVPLYPLGHSLVTFLVVFGLVTLAARRIVWPLLGWLSHILIDIPTHSFSYYATRFLWPISEVRVDGLAWWTPWFWAATYAALAVVYFALWKKGWLSSRVPALK